MRASQDGLGNISEGKQTDPAPIKEEKMPREFKSLKTETEFEELGSAIEGLLGGFLRFKEDEILKSRQIIYPDLVKHLNDIESPSKNSKINGLALVDCMSAYIARQLFIEIGEILILYASTEKIDLDKHTVILGVKF